MVDGLLARKLQFGDSELCRVLDFGEAVVDERRHDLHAASGSHVVDFVVAVVDLAVVDVVPESS